MWAVTLANTARSRANPDLRAWLSQCRLNNMTAVMRGVKPDDSAKLALLRERRQGRTRRNKTSGVDIGDGVSPQLRIVAIHNDRA
jgi:hypothetical protein